MEDVIYWSKVLQVKVTDIDSFHMMFKKLDIYRQVLFKILRDHNNWKKVIFYGPVKWHDGYCNFEFLSVKWNWLCQS